MPHEQFTSPGGDDAGTATLTWSGDRFLRVAFGDQPTPHAGHLVQAARASLQAAPIPGLRDLTPAYASILLTFDLAAITPDTERLVRRALSVKPTLTSTPQPTTVEIPVTYGGEHGEDLEDLARTHKLTTDEVISLHSTADYTVAFIGFTPGFPYIRGLPDQLATPRLPSPRPRIPAGSIGIAGAQTGIYPGGTPGGWRLIGRTPLRIFDPSREPAALLQMGDRVRFKPIAPAEFDTLAAAVAKETP